MNRSKPALQRATDERKGGNAVLRLPAEIIHVFNLYFIHLLSFINLLIFKPTFLVLIYLSEF